MAWWIEEEFGLFFVLRIFLLYEGQPESPRGCMCLLNRIGRKGLFDEQLSQNSVYLLHKWHVTTFFRIVLQPACCNC